MRLKPTQYYRKFGVRTKAHLTHPKLTPISKLTLPITSIYQFLPDDTTTIGPSSQDPLFLDLEGRLFIEHVVELAQREGNPRATVLNRNTLQQRFRRNNRRFKPLRKDAALSISPTNTLVINHGMLSHLYRYTVSYKANYYRWANVAATFWKSVADTDERFKWQQFIDLQLPDTLPTYEMFKRASANLSQKTLEVFNSPAALGLLDLWRWLGEQREQSYISTVPGEALERINFIVRVKGYFFVLNLGLIDEWRKDPEVDNDTGLEASALQRRFLALLHGIRDFTTGVSSLPEQKETPPVKTTTATNPKKTPSKTKTSDDKTTEGSSTPQESVSKAPTLDLSVPEDELELPEASLPPATPDMDLVTPEIVEEETPSLPNDDQAPLQTDEPPSLDDRLTKGIVSRAWEQHEVGITSAKAYRRALKDAETYKNLKDPYGSGRELTEMLTVTEDDLAMPEDPGVPDRDTITDKSMLKSSLKGITAKYVKDVLHKDVVSSVLAVQQQGVAVKDYDVERVQDAMNHYEVHTVTVKPVRGRQSTLRFRLPVVDEEGRFVSNGVTYKMRMQRADQPIRKINPSRVALTSYYNKTFVDRSSRAVNDYSGWLTRTVINRGLDDEDSSITHLKLSNVFDKSLTVPRAYSILAKQITSFESAGITFSFDYHHRIKFFESKGVDVESVEQTTGMLVVGVRGKEPVLVDKNSTFYLHGDDLDVLGTLHDVLGIDPSKAPLEVVEVGIANKSLPLGFVFGYQMGLSKLIERLGADVSRHPRGERLSSTQDEYTLVFQDEVLVFSRLDQRSAMVLAGFNRFKNTIRHHSVWDFDRKDIYYNLLEDIGLGVRYLREIETLFQAWMDPITRGCLESMGEPTEFGELLHRAVELLQTDYSPEEVDGAFMRYRGYERFAGMVYGELSRAAKIFNAKAGAGEHAVELNPHAVWQKVVQDPAVAPIEESNPIANLREQEAMTYRGEGGRSGKSMVERTRIYHQSDMGVVSESTVDSGDVGVVAYFSPDANFTSLRGTTRRYDKEKDGPSKLLSTSALCAPAAEHDD